MTDHIDPKDVPGSDVKGSDPDANVSVTVDSGGHVKKVEVDVHVPGTAPGSKPGHVEWGGDDPAKPKDPSWTPHITDPNEPVYNPLPVRPGWHRDPLTGIDSPDLGPVSGDAPAGGQTPDPGALPGVDVPMSEPGDYPTPDPNESIA